ncbi:MAG: hypothetical protein KIS67_28105 [Verrucomicrobiae bacterium]|nr:hypothetical protein [Verrucomicrobiae bacterium]
MLAKIRDKLEKVGLTLNVLVALNTYCRKRGLGLQQLPILETRGVLEPLMDSSRVVFMQGAKPRPEARHNDISLWDTKSPAELLAQASRLARVANVHPDGFLFESVCQLQGHSHAR